MNLLPAISCISYRTTLAQLRNQARLQPQLLFNRARPLLAIVSHAQQSLDFRRTDERPALETFPPQALRLLLKHLAI